MIKSFKLFESEIYVGTNKHYNKLKPVNVEIFKEAELYDFVCDDCFCEFSTYDLNNSECSVCGSEKISPKLLQ